MEIFVLLSLACWWIETTHIRWPLSSWHVTSNFYFGTWCLVIGLIAWGRRASGKIQLPLQVYTWPAILVSALRTSCFVCHQTVRTVGHVASPVSLLHFWSSRWHLRAVWQPPLSTGDWSFKVAMSCRAWKKGERGDCRVAMMDAILVPPSHEFSFSPSLHEYIYGGESPHRGCYFYTTTQLLLQLYLSADDWTNILSETARLPLTWCLQNSYLSGHLLSLASSTPLGQRLTLFQDQHRH